MRRLALAVAAALLLALAQGAAAEVPARAGSRTGDIAAARKLHAQGRAHYRAGRYEEAVRAFRRAYDLSHAPGVLFNLAQAQRMAGDCAAAQESYLRYLSASPREARQRETASARVRELQECARQARVAAQPAPSAAAPPVLAPPLAAAPARESDSAPGKAIRIAGLAVGVAGLALAGTGVFFGVQAADLSDRTTREFAAGGEWNGTAEARQERGQQRELLAYALIGAGATALAGGLVLYLIGRSGDSEHERARDGDAGRGLRITTGHGIGVSYSTPF